MSRNEARTAAAPADKTNFPRVQRQPVPSSGRVAYLSRRGSQLQRREARRTNAATARSNTVRFSCKKGPSERR